ncbi:pentapeptide repeat-containing protein [Microbispora triticiradicis]|uniref:pentapeptide repeat-containing protein n=1 Tax=Microbispora triticiradicis TaxID=2200763 RepID=UPI001AD6337B|nr:pentapeptide repeat-containing protein [Microbispora triticiradicis]MBO4275518.1 hypothetical protein [Microbispora triticiradicis]
MNASSGPSGPPGSSRDRAPADGRYPRIPEPTQEELDALPVERRLELLESLRRREDQERDQRRQNRHQWFNSVGILFGVLFTAAGLVATGLTLQSGQEELRTAREGQITDRYIRAVEQLAASTADVRLGAVYALQRIAADSPKDRLTVRNVLAAYVRNHDFCTTRPPASQCTAPLHELYSGETIRRLPSDVEEALIIASSLTVRGDPLADFSQTRFPRMVLAKGAHLSHAGFLRADLTLGSMSAADLTFANAVGACLTRANLTEADLSHADLQSSDLYGAQLHGAKLSGTDLRGADLRGVYGMTPDEIRAVAVTDSETKFGERRTDPAPCGPVSLLSDGPLHPL